MKESEDVKQFPSPTHFGVDTGPKLWGSDSFLLNQPLSLPHEAISLGDVPVTHSGVQIKYIKALHKQETT